MPIYGHILVVEDDEVMRGTILKVLKRVGYDVDGAEDGPEALEKTKHKIYDLIVCDVRLPGGLDGIEVIRLIKEDPKYNRIKVIIITGYSDIDVPVRAIRIKVDDFLWKPFKLEDFMEIVTYNTRHLLEEQRDESK